MRTIAFLLCLFLAGSAGADEWFAASLNGYQETPAISTTGGGEFVAVLVGKRIYYRLLWWDLEGGTVTGQHLHFGARGTAGGVAIILNGKDWASQDFGWSGSFNADDIAGPAAQGLNTGEWQELLSAMRAGMSYINVHTKQFPGGEVRGQVRGW